jgi:hypothetical protein
MNNMCDNMLPQEMATAILRMQRRCTEDDYAYIKRVLYSLQPNGTLLPFDAFEMIETYVHTKDKQSFCRLFATITDNSWTSFLEQMFKVVKTIPAPAPIKPAQRSTTCTAKGLKMMLGEKGKQTGEFGRRLDYIIQLAKLERGELAKQVGVGRTTMYRYMLAPADKGFSVPKESTALAIIAALPIEDAQFWAYPSDFSAWKSQFNHKTR